MDYAATINPTAEPSPTGKTISQAYSYNVGVIGKAKNPSNADPINVSAKLSISYINAEKAIHNPENPTQNTAKLLNLLFFLR